MLNECTQCGQMFIPFGKDDPMPNLCDICFALHIGKKGKTLTGDGDEE